MTDQDMRAEEIAHDDFIARALRTFCWREGGREYIASPFSKGEWTYASDGHCSIRVPRVAGMDGHPKAPDAEKIYTRAFVERATFTPVPPADLPTEGFVDCEYCDGRGYEHECPDCTCECGWCDGKSRESDYVGSGSPFRGVYVGLSVIKLVWLLPGLKVIDAPIAGMPIPFIFDGGQGVMMPMLGAPRKKTVDVFARHLQENPHG